MKVYWLGNDQSESQRFISYSSIISSFGLRPLLVLDLRHSLGVMEKVFGRWMAIRSVLSMTGKEILKVFCFGLIIWLFPFRADSLGRCLLGEKWFGSMVQGFLFCFVFLQYITNYKRNLPSKHFLSPCSFSSGDFVFRRSTFVTFTVWLCTALLSSCFILMLSLWSPSLPWVLSPTSYYLSNFSCQLYFSSVCNY